MVPFVENIEIMSKSKAYKKQEPIERIVNEPVMEYRSLSTIEETELLSNEIIIGAVKYAQIAREKVGWFLIMKYMDCWLIGWDGRQDPRRLQNLLIDFLTKQ